MLAVARCVLLALNVLLLATPALLEPSLGTAPAYLIATVLLTILNLVLAIGWERLAPEDDQLASRDTRSAIVIGVVAAILIAAASASWLGEILIYPHDANRADMLVVIQLAIRRLLQGGDPYAIYQVPWDVPLPYGPVMWVPYIAPLMLHADVRFVSLAGYLFVPIACAGAAVAAAANRHRALAGGWLIVLAALALSPELRHFVIIGHTPAYWPLLALLAWVTTRQHWYAAAITCGLLIVARTTMVSIAPVLLLAVWYQARPRTMGVALLLAAATLLPFLPFAFWDPHALWYGLYGSYQKVMKTFVWLSTDWVQHTIGTTGPLLALGWHRAIESVQVLAMLILYAGAAVALRRGRRPLPWMALALFVFSMTTLWPVTYLYFDVVLLLISAALSETPWIATRAVVKTWPGLLAASVTVVAVTAWLMIPLNADVDAGTVDGRSALYSGFSSDEREGDITFSWINGTRAEVLIPRRSRRDATITIVCEPHLPTPDAIQQLSVSLNGTVLGTVSLKDGWNRIELPAPGRSWLFGVNELTLFLSSAVSPKELGLSEDARRLSLAVDRLTVRTP